MDRGGSTASDTDGMTFARRPDAVLTAVGDLRKHAHSCHAAGHLLTSSRTEKSRGGSRSVIRRIQ